MLLSNLNLLATAPGGVVRLRELILTLAVQGKLVPQDPSDEPASDLLKKIRAEKERLIAEGKIKRDKPLAEIAEDEKPFELPESWQFCRLGSLVLSIRSGGTPSKHIPAYWDGDIPWASVKDLRFGEPLTNTQDRITQAGLEAGSVLAPTGSILICTRMGLGKIGEALIDVAINQDLKAVMLGLGVDKQYFINYFKTLAVVGSGMTVAGIKQDELLGFLVPLPPEAEQSRIVTRVEELMRLCDELEAKGKLEATQHEQLTRTLLGALTQCDTPEQLQESWQRMAEHFDLLLDRPEAVDALEQTILQLAVRGLLVPQDPNDEPANELLKKIRAEKDRLIAEGKIKRDKPLPPIAKALYPCALPAGWEWMRFSEIGEFRGGKTPSTQQAIYWGGEIPWITPKDMKQPLLSDSVDKVTLLAVADGLALIPSQSVLIVVRSGILRRTLPTAINIVETTINQDLKALVLVRPTLAGFVQLLIRGFEGFILENLTKVGTTVESMQFEAFSMQAFPLPPLAEQSRIVTRVNELRRLCADLRKRLAERQATQAQLAEALVLQTA